MYVCVCVCVCVYIYIYIYIYVYHSRDIFYILSYLFIQMIRFEL